MFWDNFKFFENNTLAYNYYYEISLPLLSKYCNISERNMFWL